MKRGFILLGSGLISLLVGCSSAPVAVAPVGPDPFRGGSDAPTGQLQVFSSVVHRMDDREEGGDGTPGWYAHSAYRVYDLRGRLVARVANKPGHYSTSPALFSLPPGKYLVKAHAKDYFWVMVPVTIDRGRTTTVHLDGAWSGPADAPKRDVVTTPDGTPIGWDAAASKAGRMD